MTTYSVICAAIMLSACSGNSQTTMNTQAKTTSAAIDPNVKTDTATFAGGCFWCTEAIFQQLDGVIEVKPGYTGGTVKNPGYREVCTGRTGHAEATRIVYDSTKISFADLLQVFFKTHDPTTLNRQGADVGTQYRSAVFYHNDEQKQLAQNIVNELNSSKAYDSPIVTEISPTSVFYVAEDYHQNYYNDHKNESYCQYVIQPKLEKFEKIFKDKLKKS